MKIILASASPRRKELMTLGGFDYEIMVSDIDEIITKNIPYEVVEELSCQKAVSVYDMYTASHDKGDILVIGADTVVAVDDNILGKPENEDAAYNMLHMLQGRTHQVYTGVTLVWQDKDKTIKKSFHECTRVVFYPMTDNEIWDYIKSGDPMDKAGAYGIQSGAARYVKGIEGDYNNVVGLPLARLYNEIKKMGFNI